MRSTTRLRFDEILTRLLAVDTVDDTVLTIADDERAVVARELERFLGNPTAMWAHARRVVDAISERIGDQHRLRLSPSRTDAVFENGLEILSNQELAGLAVSVIGIAQLSTQLERAVFDLATLLFFVIECQFRVVLARKQGADKSCPESVR